MSWFASLGDKQILSGRITIPLYGTWSGDIVLAGGTTVSGATALVLGDLTMRCYARPARSGTFAGKASSRVVGGAGGWNKTIAAKGYRHASGVKLSTVLKDAASAAGEQITVSSDRVIGPRWMRKRGRASRALRMLLDGAWWVDNDGVTQTKARTATTIASPFMLTDYKPYLGLFTVSTEKFKDWMPGRRFSAPTLSGTQTISSVSLVIADGKVTLHVTNSDTAEQRLVQDIRAIVRDEMCRLENGTIVTYEITRAEEQEIDCKPVDGGTEWPPLAGVPLFPGLLGAVVTPTVGKTCLIVFANNDPTLYRCIGVTGPNQKSTFETTGNVEVTTGGIFKVCGGADFVALAQKVDDGFAQLRSELDTLKTELTAHTHGSAWGPTTNPLGPFAPGTDVPSVACTKLKTD